uniref:Large ribosomal subunit protein bL19m n=1 Tax=Salmo trutta TaxID=8032 RepID=A0A674E290_SALTR
KIGKTQRGVNTFARHCMCHLVLGRDNGKPTKFTPPPKPVIIDKTQFLSPEFILPRQRINPLKFSIERKDMIQRRFILSLCFAGSVLAVTMADPHASGKINCFVGICIQRGGHGLGATFVLRKSLTICYELRLLDNNLWYLRDALPEYSTVDLDMKPIPHSVNGDVPVNKTRVRMPALLVAGDFNVGKLKTVLPHFYQHVTCATRGKNLSTIFTPHTETHTKLFLALHLANLNVILSS